MKRVIKIDVDDVQNLKSKFSTNAVEIKNISSALNEVFNTVNNSWRGVDSANFVSSSTKLVNSLNNESIFLDNWSKYLSNSSYKYEDNMDEAVMKLRSTNARYDDLNVG